MAHNADSKTKQSILSWRIKLYSVFSESWTTTCPCECRVHLMKR